MADTSGVTPVPASAPRILIVEDDAELLHLIYSVLPPETSVVSEPDGIAGVNTFRQAIDVGAPFTTVCLDVVMPGMDGGRALRAMRRYESAHCAPSKRARIVMMTTAREREIVQKAVAAGADDYLVKPFTPEELLQRLRLDPLARSA